MSQKVVVGMSGGVDSSVAALLLKKQGYDVVGLFMKNWDHGLKGSDCPSHQELQDAQKVADILEIPLHPMSFIYEYKERVFDVFLEGLKQGLTPNPDILCNREIKFDVFLKQAVELLGADKIATGHYADIGILEGKSVLKAPKDDNKNQVYFLHAITHEQISKSLFPLAPYTKQDIRQIAKEAGLPTSTKKDSTGICFIGKQKFDEFITQYLKATPGDIVDEYGKVIGTHKGLVCYTLGQRKGLHLGGGLGQAKDEGNPWYVAQKNLATNQLVVVQDTNHPLLMSDIVSAKNTHYVLEHPPKIGQTLQAQIRYRQPPQSCEVIDTKDNEITVHFKTPQRAVTLGQSLVLHDKGYCLGGGFISKYALL